MDYLRKKRLPSRHPNKMEIMMQEEIEVE